MITPEEILQASSDEVCDLVHIHIGGYERVGKGWRKSDGTRAPNPNIYTTAHGIIDLVERAGLTFGWSRPDESHFEEGKRWYSGRIDDFFVRSSSPHVAVCKAALIAMVNDQSKSAPKEGEPAEAEQDDK